jgi:hypothetical protein
LVALVLGVQPNEVVVPEAEHPSTTTTLSRTAAQALSLLKKGRGA